jgi:hypothetical protein
MAQANLLDIAKLNGSDQVVGLIEETLTYAPEVQILPARTIKGTSYKVVSRSSYPGVGFRTANEGSTPSKSEFENKLVECFILSGAIQADVAVTQAYEDGAEAWKDIEAMGAMKQALIELGSQVFYGTSVDAKGFPGLAAIHAALASGITLDAGGTTDNVASSVYGINTDVQGVQLVFGSNQTFSLGEWRIENVEGPVAGTVYPAHVANLTAWVGLQVGSKYSVGRLHSATTDASCGVTDIKLAELLSKYPVGTRPNYWLMNRRSAYQLQASRFATTIQTGNKTSSGVEVYSPTPTESNGIPIIITDSLTNTETLV